MIYVLIYLIIGVVLQLAHYLMIQHYNISNTEKMDMTAELWGDDDIKAERFSDEVLDRICDGAPTIILNVVLWPLNVVMGAYFIIRLFSKTKKK